jgi:hypothetical protein
VDEHARDVEPEAGPADAALLSGVEPEELLEDALAIAGRNPGALVGDGEPRADLALADGDRTCPCEYLSALSTRFAITCRRRSRSPSRRSRSGLATITRARSPAATPCSTASTAGTSPRRATATRLATRSQPERASVAARPTTSAAERPAIASAAASTRVS